MKIQFYKPKNDLLKKYIEGYYFIAENKNSDIVEYFTFPNNFVILSVNENSKVELKDNRITVSSSDEKNIIAGIVTSYTSPIEVVYDSAVNEITMYFKPLGINHFLEDIAVLQQRSDFGFNPYPDFENAMQAVFKEKDREAQIISLENYWLSKFKEKELVLAYQLLADIESNLKVEEIAAKNNLNRQSLRRTFFKNVGKTPAEYRKIFRFRNALTEFSQSRSLTELSHDNLFYDQSHFNKDFKSLTNTNPASFFKNVDTGKGNVWLFV
ncbi:MAG: AraC family transcriptional regulator [Pedobacter sp.]|nr:MAG: AraC family transcriptional regulator [Pedobacter sp.]